MAGEAAAPPLERIARRPPLVSLPQALEAATVVSAVMGEEPKPEWPAIAAPRVGAAVVALEAEVASDNCA